MQAHGPPPVMSELTLPSAEILVTSRRYSAFRRYLLLLIFCLAQFLDVFNNSALYPAIPSLIEDLHMSQSDATWIISAFQLTFASFLLIVSFAIYLTPKLLLTSKHSAAVSVMFITLVSCPNQLPRTYRCIDVQGRTRFRHWCHLSRLYLYRGWIRP